MTRRSHRLTRLRTLLRERQLDGLIVSTPPHVTYLSGFTGSNGLCVVTRQGATFLTDSRYRGQSARQVRAMRRFCSQRPLVESLADAGALRRCSRVGFESSHMTYQQYRSMRRHTPGVTFVPTSSLIEELLLIKDASEVVAIRAAAAITDRVFNEILPLLRPGIREMEIAAEISYRHRVHGAEGDAFPPIIASGERGALPHARASDKRLRAGECVTLDFGCTVRGYHSDLTRTVALRRLSRRGRRVYDTVREAQAKALAAVRAGITAKDLDAVARRHIAQQGYGSAFIHSLGHGLGLSIHERPRVSSLSTDVLAAGSVITIEPGVYLPGWGGVRIEDDVVVTRTGCDILTHAPKDLLVL